MPRAGSLQARAPGARTGGGCGGTALDGPGDAVMAMLSQMQIPACDLRPPLRQAHAAGQATYLQYDGHWSVDGHAVVGQAIASGADTSGLSGLR